MKKSELKQIIKEELNNIREEESSESKKDKLDTALQKAGIDTSKAINIKIVNKTTGKEQVVKYDGESFSNPAMKEGLKDKLVIAATCLILSSGMISCTKEDSLEPNKIENSLEANVDIFNTQGLNVPLEVIAKSMFPQKIKYAKDRDRQTPTLSMGKIDSAINNQNEPWCGYWKFTDPCRYNNGQVLIWTNPTDSEPYGAIWSGYQTVNPSVDSSWGDFFILKGKKYLIWKNTIHSFKYDKVKAHVSITMSNPTMDRGKIFPLEIDYSGKTMRITNWQAGNAVEVGGFGGFDFKW
jgi:hypothetical protein